MRGLKKSMELRSGAQGDYWAPTNIHVHLDSGKMEVRLELFYNKSAYEAGKQALGIAKNIVLEIPEAMYDCIDGSIPDIQAQEETPENATQDETRKKVAGYFSDAVPDGVEPKKPSNPGAP